ncbi:UNVERIFIED_CONTAM: hypothetical protein FKN15_072377 [Acipenser sinensis]
MIITTLAVKNEEIQNFILLLKQRLQNIEVNSSQAQAELESEFSSLYNVLDELKDSMLTKIKQERASKTYELQTQLSACTKALESSEELLELANQTLCTAETFVFKLDSGSSHQNLRVEGLSVEWDSTGGKVLEMKKEMKTRPASPLNSPAR